MARSKRKTPIVGNTTARSEKYDKRAANRRLRAKVRRMVRVSDGDTILPTMREMSDVWDMAKDGKRYVSDIDAEGMRK